MPVDYNKIFSLDELAVKSIRSYTKTRFVFSRLENMSGKPFTALTGPRGSGKTVLLRQLRSKTEKSIYISADTLSGETSLTELVSQLAENYRIETFFIDEIHYIKNFASQIKELYDFYPLKIFFTSSMALSLDFSAWDLSRRVIMLKVFPFTLREYIFFRDNVLLDPLSINNIVNEEISFEYLKAGYRFNDYISGGLYPFRLEAGSDNAQFESILKKIIRADIPAFDPSLKIQDIETMEKCVKFIGKSPIDGINYSSISRNTGITKYMAEKLVTLLEKSHILRISFPEGTNVLKEPKVFLELPYRLIFKSFDECIGGLREDFFALAMDQHGIQFNYLKTTRGTKTPDFLISTESESSLVIEIGGRGKGRTQFKGTDYGRKLIFSHGLQAEAVSAGNKIPLHCLGFAP